MSAGGNGDTMLFLLIVIAGLGVVIVVAVRSRRRKANIGQHAWQASSQAYEPQGYQPAGPPGAYAKRCPTCRSVYADASLAFCLSDGSPLELVPVSPGAYDPISTYPQTAGNGGNVAPTVQYNPNADPNRR